MTVLYGSVTTFASGWKFRGIFGPKNGPPEFAIEGGLNKPIEDLYVPHAELVNAKVGSFNYTGLVGPDYFHIQTPTMPDIIVLGKLSAPITQAPVAGWLQIVPIHH